MSRNLRVLIAAAMMLAALVFITGCGKKPVASQPAGQASKETAAVSQANETQAEAVTAQTTCPVMESNPINKNIFVEYQGKKVYFCCKGCPEQFLANPEKYTAKLPQFQQ